MSRNRLALSLTATLLGGTAMADVPNVAVDIAPVHSLVAMVMDGVGEPALIIPAGASPHEYSLRPSEAAAMQDADLFVWVGPALSPWLDNAVDTLAGDAAVLTLLDQPETVLLPFREDALFEHDHSHHDHEAEEAHGHDHDADDHDAHAHDEHDHGHDEHDHDDHAHDAHDHHDHEEHAHEDHDHHDHGHEEHADDAHDHEDHAHDDHDHGHHHDADSPDTHVWLSPENADIWLGLIADQLAETDPENADQYRANAEAARGEIAATVDEVAATLAPLEGGRFILFHDAFQYFENAFDFPAAGAISVSDASTPGPARIAEIQGRIQNEGVDCVLSEPQYDPGLVATVLDGTEAATAVIDPLGSDLTPGAALYPQLLRNIAASLSACLGPDG